MSITDELRKWGYGFCGSSYEVVNTIADRIDAEHEAMLEDARKYVHEDYVGLPKDADGEVIRIGDVMENLREDLEPRLHHKFKVYGIHYRAYGQACALTEDGYPNILYRAHECRHYHEPTIEDVLHEFAERLDEIGSEDDCCGVDEQECRACVRRDIDAAYAEYAERLRDVVKNERD